MRQELGIPNDAVVALYVGRLKVEKGVVELAAAFARTRTTKPLYLVFVGPDEAGMTPRLQALCAHTQRLRMAGYTPQPEHYMAMADFICLPSHREGFGMVVIEAASCGVPAIGTRVSGVSDAIVDTVTGLQFEVGNVDQLGQALTRMTDDQPWRQGLAEAARKRVLDQFEQGAVVERYVRYLLAAL